MEEQSFIDLTTCFVCFEPFDLNEHKVPSLLTHSLSHLS